MSMMEEALASATDTKACVVGPGAADGAAAMFRDLFPIQSHPFHVISAKVSIPDYQRLQVRQQMIRHKMIFNSFA